jgi:HEPN domain-containing protein
MVDIQKQIDHWRQGSLEEWDVASELIQNRRLRHGLFLAHLAVEKILKAHVCKKTNDIAPRIHNLVRLSEIAMLSMSSEDLAFLAKLNRYNIEGRYIEHQTQLIDVDTAKNIMLKTGDMLECLKKML